MTDEHTTASLDLYCPGCNYSLRGLESDRCPECGLDVVEVKRRASRIPWVHRAEVGRVRAYWKTVWMVSFRFRDFCNEIGVPAHLADAKLFRRITIPVALLPIVAMAIAIISQPTSGNPIPIGDLALYWGLGLTGFLSSLILMTGTPFYALRHRDLDLELQHRAAVLCLYAASANFAWMFVVAVFVVAGLVMGAFQPRGLADAVLYMVAGGLFTAILGLTASDVMRVIKKGLKTPKATFSISIKVFLLWVGAALLGFFGVPFALFFLGLIYYSVY